VNTNHEHTLLTIRINIVERNLCEFVWTEKQTWTIENQLWTSVWFEL